MKKLLIIGILMVLGIFCYGNFAFAIIPTMDFDLGNSDASFLGEAAWDWSGRKIFIVGDVNADGFDDFLIGAGHNDEGGDMAGQIYLILGKAGGWAMDTNLSNADASFIGEAAEDKSGWSVSGAGDVNADGFDDFLIGAYMNDEGGDMAGQIYLILGKAGGWAMDTNLSNADASFIGENITDLSGFSVSSAGDVNADGFDDFLIGAESNDEGGANAGQTYLILGKAGGWAMNTNLSNADASFIGEAAGDSNGHSVSSAGDVNADGFDDFLTGSVRAGGAAVCGEIYLILGKAGGWAMDTNLSNADASFIGEQIGDLIGWGSGLSGAGDVNADGFDDFLIGAHPNGEGGVDAGQTYLILGKAAGWVMNSSIFNVDASFLGEHAGDGSGRSVSCAGDVNADGFDDFLIGAYMNDEGGAGAGQTYLIFGKAGGWAMDTNLSNADASFIGENNIGLSGIGLSGAGDVNADGFDDFLIGAPFDNSEAGQTYLILTEPPVSVTIEAKDKNGVLIPDGGAIWDYDNNDSIVITSAATANVASETIWLHRIQFSIDTDSHTVLCGAAGTCIVDICAIVDCSTKLVPGAIITYSSIAVDTGTPPNSGSSATKSFTVGTTWAKAFGGVNWEVNGRNKAMQTSDGGYIIGGSTGSYGSGDDLLIIKLDPSGNLDPAFGTTGAITFGRNPSEMMYSQSIQQTDDDGDGQKDDGYIVSVTIYLNPTLNPSSQDFLVLKLDSNGTEEWNKTFGGNDIDYRPYIKQTTDGGYIISGIDSSYGLCGMNNIIIKLNSLGVQQWNKVFNCVTFNSIEQTTDGGCIIVGRTSSYGTIGGTFLYDILVLKLDSLGNKQWTKFFGGAADDSGLDVLETTGGGYIISGETNSFGAPLNKKLFIKLDSNGDIDLTFGTTGAKIFEDADFSTIQQISDGGYILTGGNRVVKSISGNSMVKLDSSGTQQWVRKFTGVDANGTQAIQQTLDGGYIFSGETTLYDPNSDFIVIKLDSSGNMDNCPPLLPAPLFATSDVVVLTLDPNIGGFSVGGGVGQSSVALVSSSVTPLETNACGPCNTAPTVNAGAAVQPGDYCGLSPRATLNWVFVDADGDSQGAFQVQVDDDAGFGSPIIDTGKVSPSFANSYNTSLFGPLVYNTTYHWRVKVWDDQIPDAESAYSTGTSFLTPPHKYPCADFTFSPVGPLAGDVVSFDASAEGPCSCFGVGSQAYGAGDPLVDYSWDFDGDSVSDANGALPTANYTYIAEGSYSVELIVTDSSGFSCPSCAQTINVGKGMPKWKEVVPR